MHFLSADNVRTWVGVEEGAGGELYWSDDTAVTKVEEELLFGSGEPSGDGSCVCITPNGDLNDNNCALKMNYVCELHN